MKKIFLFFFLLFVWGTLFGEEIDLNLDFNGDGNPSQNDSDLSLKKDRDEKKFKYSGYFQNTILGTDTQNQSGAHNTFLLSSLKLNLGAGYVSDTIDAQIQLDSTFVFSNNMPGLDFYSYKPVSPRNRLIPDIYQKGNNDFYFKESVKRGYFKYQSGGLILSVGRQAIGWGEGRFLNPADLITPLNPFAFDMDDIEGADCMNFHYFFNSSDSIQMVAVPYLRENKKNLDSFKTEDTNFLVKSKTTIESIDATLIAGYHFHSSIFGAEINTTQWDASFRVSYLLRREENRTDSLSQPGIEKKIASEITHQIVLGSSYAFFNGKLKTTLELFFNSSPYKNNDFIKNSFLHEQKVLSGKSSPLLGDPTFFYTSGRILTKNSFLPELGLNYNLTDLITLDLFAIYDPQGSSAYLHPGVNFSLSDEAALSIGANFYVYSNNKEDQAEFGGLKTAVYGFLKWYF